MYNICGRDMNFLKFCKERTTARSPYSFVEGGKLIFVMGWSTIFGVCESWRTEKPFCELGLKCTLWNLNCQNPWLFTHTLKINVPGFANFIDEWSQCDFCFTNFGVILEYLESSIRLSSTWSWLVYTIVRDTRSSCGGPLTWKAQIHDGGHRVNFNHNLTSSCFVVQYNSLISLI